MRLSVADGDLKDDKSESNSIENQRMLLTDYAAKNFPDEYVDEYVDDGYSGTNFDRPSFTKMIDDVKAGIINTIVVKDLSRLGRNYVEVGNYLEQIFPLLNVRFIAIDSNYDSDNYLGNISGLDVSLQNLVNTMYCQDISQKYKAAVRTKWKEGKSTTWRAPYGYIGRKDKMTEKVIDPEAAKVVRFIFDQALAGVKTNEIARKLNSMGVITPGEYLNRKGILKPVRITSNKEERLWNSGRVARIIKKYEYTGAMVQGKKTNLKVGSKKYRQVSEDEMFVMDGVYEPIVSIEEYHEAQKILAKGTRRKDVDHDYALKGKIYCGNCHRKMAILYNKGWTRVYCLNKASAAEFSSCDDTRYRLTEVDEKVYGLLRDYLSCLIDLMDAYEEKKGNADALNRELDMLEPSIGAAKRKLIYLYENYANGDLTKEGYIQEKKKLNDNLQQMQSRQVELMEIKQSRSELEQESKIIRLSADNVLKGDELTREMVDAFIDKIIIYDSTHWEIVYSCEDVFQRLIEACTHFRGSHAAEFRTGKGTAVDGIQGVLEVFHVPAEECDTAEEQICAKAQAVLICLFRQIECAVGHDLCFPDVSQEKQPLCFHGFRGTGALAAGKGSISWYSFRYQAAGLFQLAAVAPEHVYRAGDTEGPGVTCYVKVFRVVQAGGNCLVVAAHFGYIIVGLKRAYQFQGSIQLLAGQSVTSGPVQEYFQAAAGGGSQGSPANQ